MISVPMTAYSLAERFVGINEIPGPEHHPLILWWHSLCTLKATTDEIAWCSAFAVGIAWELQLPNPRSARARDWLTVGRPVELEEAERGFDIIVLKRGRGEQPGPDVLAAPGHVAWFSAYSNGFVDGLGGNQSNAINLRAFSTDDILGIRRLTP